MLDDIITFVKKWFNLQTLSICVFLICLPLSFLFSSLITKFHLFSTLKLPIIEIIVMIAQYSLQIIAFVFFTIAMKNKVLNIKSEEKKTFWPLLLIFGCIIFVYTLSRIFKDEYLNLSLAGTEGAMQVKTLIIFLAPIYQFFYVLPISKRFSGIKLAVLLIAPLIGYISFFAFYLCGKEFLLPNRISVLALAGKLPKLATIIKLSTIWPESIYYIAIELWSTSLVTVFCWQIINRYIESKEARSRLIPGIIALTQFGVLAATYSLDLIKPILQYNQIFAKINNVDNILFKVYSIRISVTIMLIATIIFLVSVNWFFKHNTASLTTTTTKVVKFNTDVLGTVGTPIILLFDLIAVFYVLPSAKDLMLLMGNKMSFIYYGLILACILIFLNLYIFWLRKKESSMSEIIEIIKKNPNFLFASLIGVFYGLTAVIIEQFWKKIMSSTRGDAFQSMLSLCFNLQGQFSLFASLIGGSNILLKRFGWLLCAAITPIVILIYVCGIFVPIISKTKVITVAYLKANTSLIQYIFIMGVIIIAIFKTVKYLFTDITKENYIAMQTVEDRASIKHLEGGLNRIGKSGGAVIIGTCNSVLGWEIFHYNLIIGFIIGTIIFVVCWILILFSLQREITQLEQKKIHAK